MSFEFKPYDIQSAIITFFFRTEISKLHDEIILYHFVNDNETSQIVSHEILLFIKDILFNIHIYMY